MSTYIHVNFRGTVKPIHKEYFEEDSGVGYLRGLYRINFKDSPKDEKGYLMINESSTHFFHLVDLYKAWLGEGSPRRIRIGFPDSYITMYSGIAERLGFDLDFIKAMRNKINDDDVRKDKLFKCYYCDQVFRENEKDKNKECKYHGIDCVCHNGGSKYGCKRLPYHLELPLEIATEPREIK